MGMPVIPDFILPVLTNLGGLSRPCSIYAQPMAYSQSLAAMAAFPHNTLAGLDQACPGHA